MCYGVQVAYTFDAGPNAVLYLEKKNMDRVLSVLLHYLLPNGTKPKRCVACEFECVCIVLMLLCVACVVS